MNEELLEKSIKKAVNDKVNLVLRDLRIGFALLFICIAVIFALQIKTIKKVHYRYFNITHSLEDIHNVKIDTHLGNVIKKY